MHGKYWLLPLLAAAAWFITLSTMLIFWEAQGRPRYRWMGKHQTFPYISDVGATHQMKPVFIAGSVITVVLFDIAFIMERQLRKRGRLARYTSRTQVWLDRSAILFSLVGAAGLILLTIFDTKRYHTYHDVFLLVFIGAYLIAAILVCWEYRLLGQDLRIANLRWAFGIKLFFIIAEIALVAAFQAYRFQKAYNTSAYFEWIVALVNISFVASFAFDFLPVTPVKRASQNYPMM